MPCASPGSYRISWIHYWTAWHKRSLALVSFGLGWAYASSFLHDCVKVFTVFFDVVMFSFVGVLHLLRDWLGRSSPK